MDKAIIGVTRINGMNEPDAEGSYFRVSLVEAPDTDRSRRTVCKISIGEAENLASQISGALTATT